MASSDKDNSTASLAAFRRGPGAQFAGLAEEHFKHDLEESDRSALKSAASTISTHATIGTAIGLGLGFALAWRIRSGRVAAFRAFKAHERPVKVEFNDGRTEALPDMTPLLKPTPFGDFFTFFFFGAGGLFIGGETGLMTGSWRAGSAIRRDPESQKRIETAFRRFRADVLKAQIAELERDDGSVSRRGKDLLGL
ncbi:MAG: hypothetical protein M1820_007916 [Bogoriella megaspora]|nr:MAG: hypothetical protein M1820_007916 [Bogoriella megaspora]